VAILRFDPQTGARGHRTGPAASALGLKFFGYGFLTVDGDDIAAIKRRLEELRIEHRDLDDVITRLTEDPLVDQLQLRRLKKRKLQLKDFISKLERQLIPDLNA